MSLTDHLQGGFGVAILLFLCIIAVLWFFLPFAVFGIKERLDEQIVNQKLIIELLKERAAGVR
jgi:hypothetical protein